MPCPTTPAPQTGGSRLSDGHRRRRRRGRVGGTWRPPAAATAAAAAAGGNAVPPPHSPSHVPARGWGEGGSLEECAHSTCGGNEVTSSGGEGRVRVSGFSPPPSLFYPTPSRPTRRSLSLPLPAWNALVARPPRGAVLARSFPHSSSRTTGRTRARRLLHPAGKQRSQPRLGPPAPASAHRATAAAGGVALLPLLVGGRVPLPVPARPARFVLARPRPHPVKGYRRPRPS